MGKDGETQDTGPLRRLEHGLAPWVAFLVLPVFALFNAGVPLSGGGKLLTPVALGVLLGLLVGKPLGVLGACWVSTRLRLASLPEGVGWGGMAGLGMLAAIGFTVSLFISGLAFGEVGPLFDQARLGTLAASVLAAALGLALLGLLGARKRRA
jgi:NhaA family Na+:H+ antiporter